MKKLVFLLLVMFFGCFSQKAIAYDFSAVNDYNQTIWYNITSDSTVEVTHEGTIGSQGIYQGIKYYGDIIIPPSVINNGITYKVTSIGIATFRQFEVLSVTMPETILSIDDFAFQSCENLTSITIPNSVVNIGSHAFEYCNGLNTIIIPNSVTTIGYAALRCALDTLIIGSSVILIGEEAILNDGLYIISYAITPPTIYENTFSGYFPDNYLYVPCQSLTAYQNAPYWSEFNYIQCIGLDDISLESFKINIYPNPANDNITLKIDGFSKGLVLVYDIMGKEVLSKQIGGKETIIDISNFPSGVYIIKAISYNNKQIENGKFIKQ